MFDLVVPTLLMIALQGVFRTIAVIITISIVNWYLIPIILFLAVFCYFTM